MPTSKTTSVVASLIGAGILFLPAARVDAQANSSSVTSYGQSDGICVGVYNGHAVSGQAKNCVVGPSTQAQGVPANHPPIKRKKPFRPCPAVTAEGQRGGITAAEVDSVVMDANGQVVSVGSVKQGCKPQP